MRGFPVDKRRNRILLVVKNKPHERMREDLICVVEEFSSAHADKSKLLHGIQYEIMGTFGVTTRIDAAAAERFAQALRIAKNRRAS
jgi:hypothetical protein